MTNPEDLIVFDGEYQYASRELKKYGKELKIFVEKYVSIVTYITENAIKDPRISSRLLRIVEKAKALEPQIDALTTSAAAECTNFVSEIDAADQFLY